MLLGFRAENVRSFRDEFEISLLATKLSDLDAVREISWRAGGKTLGVLPVAGVFGANASGKSGLLRAMSDMRGYVLHSFRRGNPTGGFPREPFALGSEHAGRPSRFEIDLVLDGIRHEYGFIVDDELVLEEWAIAYPNGRAAVLFEREGQELRFGRDDRTAGRAVQALLRPNALFLSTAAAANHSRLLDLYSWFERNLGLATTLDRPNRQALTTKLLRDPDRGRAVLTLLQAADLGVVDAEHEELDPAIKDRLERAAAVLMGRDEEPDDDGIVVKVELEDFGVRLLHRGTEGPIALPSHAESQGTLVWFGLVGPVLQALADGTVLLADELDASLHPALVEQVIRLFQDPETNPRRGQLVFNSHDFTVLGDSTGKRMLGRDQIWLTEKHDDGATRLFPLSDLNPRKDEALERRYLSGRYGGVPLIQPGRFADAVDLTVAGTVP